MSKLNLNGRWTLKQHGTDDTIPATVPGCVHTDLLANKKIADPYFQDNEAISQWIGETDWIYQKTFRVTPNFLQHTVIRLQCAGLDTLATIKLNDHLIGQTDNMFRRWEFDVKPWLRAGENQIEIRFRTTIPIITRKQKENFLNHSGLDNHHRISGGNWIRKEQCNFGWDWGPKLVTCGIWRSISIEGMDKGRLLEVHCQQNHKKKRVDLSLETTVEIISRPKLSVQFILSYKGKEIASATAPILRGKAGTTLTIKDPELWWPNGMGKQPLYTLKTILLDSESVSLDTQSKRIGLRTLELVRKKDKWGESFYFAANGVRFFAKGANWIPADTFDNWVTDKKYASLLTSAVAANMNMLRVWGGGIYENDIFYDLCDELGLCVWQDFMFACSAYPTFEESFAANVKVEAIENVQRLRHHACLAIWCGNNEVEHCDLIETGEGSMRWDDYSALFDRALKKIVQQHDPERPYWPSSSHSPIGDRADANNPGCGDAHLWKVWHGREPFEWYRTSFHRFCSEFGFQSFPDYKTVQAFTEPKDRNISSFVMEKHQRSPIGNSAIIDYMLSWFRMPTGFENTVYLSQLLQALAIKYAVEHWRRNTPRCMGALYWQLNDCWPAVSWSSIDYFHRWKALHYAAKRFFAPFLLSGVEDLEKEKIDFFLTNDHLQAVNCSVESLITDLDGKVIRIEKNRLTTTPSSSRKIGSLDLSTELEQYREHNLLIWLSLKKGSKVLSSNLITFARPKHLELKDPKIRYIIKKSKPNQITLELSCKKPALWVHLDHPDFDLQWSDNIIHLSPHQKVTVKAQSAQSIYVRRFKQRLRIKSLFDTYE